MPDVTASSEQGDGPVAPRGHRQPRSGHRHDHGAPVSGGHDHGGVYDNRDAVRAVVLSAVALGIASAVEFAAAAASRSAGVLADGLHNAGDVATTFVLLFAFALARRPATRRFPSGYGRIEDVATLLIVVIVVVTAAVAAYESIRKLVVPEQYTNIPFSLFAAAV